MYTLKELSDKAFQELLNAGLSYKTVYGSNWYIWNRLITKYGPNTIFEEKMVYEYCEEYFARNIYDIDYSKLRKCEKRYISAFNYLMESNKDNLIEKQDVHFHKKYNLNENSENLLHEYIELCKLQGNSERTLKNKYVQIRNFIIDSDFEHLNKESLINYLNKRKNDMNPTAYKIEMGLLRLFLVFCFEKGSISKEILLLWPSKIKNVSNKEVPSVYSPSEINQLLCSSKGYTYEENHLRNYAILCLITYSGIRANDVVNLKLSDIDWRANIIKFTQQKTCKELIIPLIPEIGNPLIDYLKNERKTKHKYVFVTENGGKLTTVVVTGIINTYFSNAPFDLKGRHYGAHALRHSLATNLINCAVPAFSVANTLGHADSRSISIYAKVDLNNLRKCVLEVPYRA